MTMAKIAENGLGLLGCGKMGSAMLQGWLDKGLSPESVRVLEPNPSDWLKKTGVEINIRLHDAPAVVVIAVKPQMMEQALPTLKTLGNGATLFISVAAGTPISAYEDMLGKHSPIIRAMPNTPAAVGRGITAMVGNNHVRLDHLEIAQNLLSAVGEVTCLETEDQMDAVTGVSGSGPAYVFHLIECLSQAGQNQGLSPDLALRLARATVAGAGVLAQESGIDPATLRENVTSPGGTTQAGLAVLMDESNGLPLLIDKTVAAATHRSKELGNG